MMEEDAALPRVTVSFSLHNAPEDNLSTYLIPDQLWDVVCARGQQGEI